MLSFAGKYVTNVKLKKDKLLYYEKDTAQSPINSIQIDQITEVCLVEKVSFDFNDTLLYNVTNVENPFNRVDSSKSKFRLAPTS